MLQLYSYKQLAFYVDIPYTGRRTVFVSEPINVSRNKKDNSPVRFEWRGLDRKVIRVLSQWQEWKFPAGVHKPTWRQRRHRNYFKIEASDGKIYEIYMDRQKAHEPAWFLYRVLEGNGESSKAGSD